MRASKQCQGVLYLIAHLIRLVLHILSYVSAPTSGRNELFLQNKHPMALKIAGVANQITNNVQKYQLFQFFMTMMFEK